MRIQKRHGQNRLFSDSGPSFFIKMRGEEVLMHEKMAATNEEMDNKSDGPSS